MTFAKKMLTCGVYHSDETKVMTPYRHFNTYMGDPVRTVLTAEQNKCIKEDNLLELVNETGSYLKGRMNEMA